MGLSSLSGKEEKCKQYTFFCIFIDKNANCMLITSIHVSFTFACIVQIIMLRWQKTCSCCTTEYINNGSSSRKPKIAYLHIFFKTKAVMIGSCTKIALNWKHFHLDQETFPLRRAPQEELDGIGSTGEEYRRTLRSVIASVKETRGSWHYKWCPCLMQCYKLKKYFLHKIKLHHMITQLLIADIWLLQ